MPNIFKILYLSAATTLVIPMNIMAQETPAQETEVFEDEVIAEGRRQWEGHKGMDAFWSGDYEEAEIQFEREFKSLKRNLSARRNAAEDAALALDRANIAAQAGGSSGQVIATPGGSVSVATSDSAPANVSIVRNYNNKRVKGKNLLNDGIVTDEDFAFTKYMSGLSELQLGKNAEAKKSFKRSVNFDGSNYDARMRLGLLYIVDRDFDKAADQLEALEKMRVKCKKKQCEEYQEIRDSATTLANHITATINNQN